MSKIISIGNQKGGVGKSTLTSFVANYIFNNMPDKKVLVIDADDLQNTLYKIRQQEIAEYDLDISKLYPLITINSKDIPQRIESLVSRFDYIFIDLPGNLKQPGVVSTYFFVDYIFIPMTFSKQDTDSTLDFVEFLKTAVVNKRKEVGLNTLYKVFLNNINVTHSEFKSFQSNPEGFPFPIMRSFIPNNVVFSRNASTFALYENKQYGDYKDFFNEFFSIIN